MNTPYLKFNEDKLINNYKNFYHICQQNFDNKFKICFSVKTNSNKEVIKTLEKINSGFEIASLKELKITSKKYFRVMNGPAKTEDEIKFALKNNVLIFIDSFSELDKIIKISKNNNISKHFFGVRIDAKNSKFGISEKQIKFFLQKAKENKIDIKAIQIHQGTLTKITEFQKNLKELKKIILPYLKEIEYLDFGGGYPDNFQLKNLNLSLKDYLIEIKNNFSDFLGIFIFEPGRNLVSDAYTLITKVVAIKEKNNETYVILDAGINILSKITLANFKFNKISTTSTKKINNLKKQENRTYILSGPLLFNNDILGKWQGQIKENELLEVENVGAYCENLSWKIIYGKIKTYSK